MVKTFKKKEKVQIVFRIIEKLVRKGKNSGYQRFLLFPHLINGTKEVITFIFYHVLL